VIRGAAGLEEVAWPDALRTVAQRLRHVASLYGRGSMAVVTGGDLTNEEAFGWSLVARELGGRTASSPTAAAGAWERLDPYAARLVDLEDADLVVVIGDAEPSDRAGIVDLRIRQARRNGAHLAVVGPGGTSLELDAHSHVQVAAGSVVPSVAALAEAVRQGGGENVRHRPGTEAPRPGEIAGPERLAATAGGSPEGFAELAARLTAAAKPVVIVTDQLNLEWVENLAWTCSLDVRAGGVLPMPTGANERGARAAGLGGGGDEVLAGLEAGQIRAVVLVGLDPMADWPEAERWQAALASAEVVVSTSAYPSTAVSWSHIALPANVDLEREGTTMNLEGRVQRLRRVVPPPSGVDELDVVSALTQELRLSVPPTAPQAFAVMAESRPAFAGLRWSALQGRAPLPERARRLAPSRPPWPALVEADPAPSCPVPRRAAGRRVAQRASQRRRGRHRDRDVPPRGVPLAVLGRRRRDDARARPSARGVGAARLPRCRAPRRHRRGHGHRPPRGGRAPRPRPDVPAAARGDRPDQLARRTGRLRRPGGRGGRRACLTTSSSRASRRSCS
jgi:anaerobic selenocysteine-containing dehydrogenase